LNREILIEKKKKGLRAGEREVASGTTQKISN